MNCPKCKGPTNETTDGLSPYWCPTCQRKIRKDNCVACGATFWRFWTEGNHVCNPKREAQIENARLASAEPREYPRCFSERLADGVRMLQESGSWDGEGTGE